MNVVWARNAARSGAWWPGLIQDLTHAPVGVLNQILAYGDNSGYFIRFVGPPSTSNGPDYSTSKVEQMPWDDAGSQHKAILSVSNEADARAQRQAILEIHNVLSPQLARSQVIQVPSSQPVNLLVPQQQGAVTLHPHAMSIPLPIVLQQATTAHGSGVSSSNPAQSMHRPVTVQQQLIPRVSGAVHVLLQPGNRPASSGVLQQPQPSLEQQGQALLKGYEQRLRHLHAQVLNPEGRTCFFAEMQRLHQEGGIMIPEGMDINSFQMMSWNQLPAAEQKVYDTKAQAQSQAYREEYSMLQDQYFQLGANLKLPTDPSLALPGSTHAQVLSGLGHTNSQLHKNHSSPYISHPSLAGPEGSDQLAAGRGGRGRGRGRGRPPLNRSGPSSVPAGEPTKRHVEGDEEGGEPCGLGRPVKRERTTELAASAPDSKVEEDGTDVGGSAAKSLEDMPSELPIICNGVRGVMILSGVRVICSCAQCSALPEASRPFFHPTHWEQHCGAGSAKKWKASLKVLPGGAPEVPKGGNPMSLGRWFDLKGVDFRPAKTLGGPPILEFLGRPIQRTAAPLPSPDSFRPVRTTASNLILGSMASSNSQPATIQPRNHTSSLGLYTASAVAPYAPPKPTQRPWEDEARGLYQPIKVRWAGDRCCACDSDVDFDFDQLVSCDSCGITVHQSCYGIMDLPDVDDMWMCRSCEHKEEGQKQPQCCLCPVVGGALKPTSLPGSKTWCHAACMQWIPEVTTSDFSRVEPIEGIDSIQKERWELICCVCRQRMGAKIQCQQCYTAYHPLCGRMAGLKMEMKEDPEGNGRLQFLSYCPKHCRPRPELSGVQIFEEGCDPGDGSLNALWNAQPFRPPPAVPLQPCEQGCARAQSITDALDRIGHGTGAGWTSLKGFWIPPKPSEEVSKALFLGYASRGRGRGRPRGRGRGRVIFTLPREMEEIGEEVEDGDPQATKGRGRGRSRGGGMTKVGATSRPAALAGPPAPADLTPLPEGVPESLPVVCGSHRGRFSVRTQRVTYQGQEYTASRFEQISGRGDAKKWKTSVWLVDEHGQPEMQMQDWLSQHKFDRNALAKLLINALEVEEYQNWLSCQQEQETHAEKEEEEVGPSSAVVGVVKADQTTKHPPLVQIANIDQELVSSETTAMGVDANKVSCGVVKLEHASRKGKASEATGAEDEAKRGVDIVGGPDDMEVDDGGGMPQVVPASSRDMGGEAVSGGKQAETEGKANVGRAFDGEEGRGEDEVGAGGCAFEAMQDGATVPAAEEPGMTLVRPRDVVLLEVLIGKPSAVAVAECIKKGQVEKRPEDCVGHCCRVFWPDDNEWYTADVVGYDAEAHRHRLWYHIDEQYESLDLVEEEKQDRLQWLPLVDSTLWPPPPSKTQLPVPLPQQQLPHQQGAAASMAVIQALLKQQPQQGGTTNAAFLQALLVQQLAAASARGAPSTTLALQQQLLAFPLVAQLLAAQTATAQPPSATGPSHQQQVALEPVMTALSSAVAPPATAGNVQLLSTPAVEPQPVTSKASIFTPPSSSRTDASLVSDPVPQSAASLPTSYTAAPLPTYTAVSIPQETHAASDCTAPDCTAPATAQVAAITDEELILAADALDDPSDVTPPRTEDVNPASSVTPPKAEDMNSASAAKQARIWKDTNPASGAAPEVLPVMKPVLEASAADVVHDPALTVMTTLQLSKAADSPLNLDIASALPEPASSLQSSPLPHAPAMIQVASAAPPAPTPPAPSAAPREPVPEAVNVITGTLKGVFNVKQLDVTLEGGRKVSPTEFERLAGKGASKKWKVTMRIMKADGKPGITMQDWLVQAGIEGPRARPASSGLLPGSPASAMEAVRRRQTSAVLRQNAAEALGGGGVGRGRRRRRSSGVCDDSEEEETESEDQEEELGTEGVSGGGVVLESGGGGRAGGTRTHRVNCMCVICKQARASGGTWGGMGSEGTATAAAAPSVAAPSALLRGSYHGAGHPNPRFGKRAFLQALPTLPMSLAQHRYWDMPVFKVWDPEEWQAAQAATAAKEAAAAAAVSTLLIKEEPDSVPKSEPAEPSSSLPEPTPSQPCSHTASSHPSSRAPTPPPSPLPTMLLPMPPAFTSAAQGSATNACSEPSAAGGSSATAPEATSSGLTAPSGIVKSEKGNMQGPGVKERQAKTVPWRERLRQCRILERERLAFGKSGVHGWGIFARKAIPQDTPVFEYRGDTVRSVVADLREHRYREEGCDCYLFRLNDLLVLDATKAGSISRFTNHCCSPSLYTRIVEFDGESHVVFFTKSDIRAGQELTFDYRFKVEDDDRDKVPCHCGAPDCKGFLN